MTEEEKQERIKEMLRYIEFTRVSYGGISEDKKVELYKELLTLGYKIPKHNIYKWSNLAVKRNDLDFLKLIIENVTSTENYSEYLHLKDVLYQSLRYGFDNISVYLIEIGVILDKNYHNGLQEKIKCKYDKMRLL
jgi:hypothetical protein